MTKEWEVCQNRIIHAIKLYSNYDVYNNNYYLFILLRIYVNKQTLFKIEL
jgi:hypothetical protein